MAGISGGILMATATRGLRTVPGLREPHYLSFRNRHEAGAVMQTDYAGHTIPVTDPATGRCIRAQIFVAVLGASNYTFAWASLTQTLPDWIEAQVRALKFFAACSKAIVCDNLKAAVVKPLWFEPAITQTFADMATHYDTTVLVTYAPRKPRDKGKVEGAVLIIERWILARLRNMQFFSVMQRSTSPLRNCWPR